MARRRRNSFAPSESQIQAAIVDHWRLCGAPSSLVAAIPNARAFGQAGLTRGLPDLVVLSPRLGERAGFIELKADDGALSHAQHGVLALMRRLGVPYAVTRGRDEPIAVLERWGAVRPQAQAGAAA